MPLEWTNWSERIVYEARQNVEATTIAPMRSQSHLFRKQSWFSPAATFYQSVYVIAASDAGSEASRLTQVLDYLQRTYAPYLFKMQVQEVIEAGGKTPKRRRLDFSAMPRLESYTDPLMSRINRGLTSIGALVFYSLLFFIASYVAFIKMRVK